MATAHGRFIPRHPEKYIGNVNQIFFRSSWEERFLRWLDSNAAVLKWGSEELAIPYVHPIKRDPAGRPKIARYFPDFIILYKHVDGSVRKEIIEIKPYKETVRKPRMNARDAEAVTINEAKWAAATKFAEDNGALFRVVTERTLFRGTKTRVPPAMGKAV